MSESPVESEAVPELPDVAERLALALNQGGMQRMTSRVLAAFLFSDRDSVTAGDLAAQLGASAGSISAAIKMLTTVALIEKTPVPASRRDHYRMRDDAWATLMSTQNTMITMMREVAETGLAATTEDSPAAVRLRQMRDFYAYMLSELPALIDRWHASQGQTPTSASNTSPAVAGSLDETPD
ncbi:MAG: GbsR/MarR family transcriptional regulator [Pseudonocardiaceae bacterium]